MSIKLYDYLTPLKCDNSYHIYLRNKYKNLFKIQDNVENEEILRLYLLSRPSPEVFVTFSKSYTKLLKKNTFLHYYKKCQFSYNEILAIFFQITYGVIHKYSKLVKYVNGVLLATGNNKINKKIGMWVYFYETSPQQPFYIDKYINENNENNENNESNESNESNRNINENKSNRYYYADDKLEVQFLTGLFLNRNSLEILKNQNIERLYKLHNDYSYIGTHIALYELRKDNVKDYVIIGDYINYIMGLTQPGEVTMITKKDLVYDPKEYEPKILVKVKYMSHVGNVGYDDLVHDPSYHFYFMGIRFMIQLEPEYNLRSSLKRSTRIEKSNSGKIGFKLGKSKSSYV